MDFQFDNTFSGTPPAGAAPWAEVVLQDIAPGQVQLTITDIDIASSEKVTELYLNLNPTLSPTSLVFANTGGSGGVTAPLPLLGVDSFKADGDGKYDILFQFSQTPASATMSSADYLTYMITGIPTLTAADFNYLSLPAGGHGPFLAAMHVQGIGAADVSDGTSYSGWIAGTAVPEPSVGTLLLLAGVLASRVRAGRNRSRAR